MGWSWTTACGTYRGGAYRGGLPPTACFTCNLLAFVTEMHGRWLLSINQSEFFKVAQVVVITARTTKKTMSGNERQKRKVFR